MPPPEDEAMQNIEDTPLKNLNNLLSQRDNLELAEYGTVAVSVIGSLAAAISGKILYAAAPLTVAAALNLVNRQRFQQQTRLYITSEIADIHNVIQSFHQQLPQPLPDSSPDLYPAIAPAETLDLSPITDAISQLQRVTERLDSTVLRQDDWENINVRFLMIDEALAEIKNITQYLQQPDTVIEESEIDLTSLASTIQQLQEQVMSLEQQNREIIKPYLQRLTRAVKNLSPQ
ncbi:MAG: hypothetical protein RLZZ338_716 [Cyanobacteriota bacterium]|jgi:hypothetical protein